MHTDVTAWIASAQHLAGAAKHRGSVARRGAARQHEPAAHQLGDASESDDEPGCDRYDRNEAEDALTG